MQKGILKCIEHSKTGFKNKRTNSINEGRKQLTIQLQKCIQKLCHFLNKFSDYNFEIKT